MQKYANFSPDLFHCRLYLPMLSICICWASIYFLINVFCSIALSTNIPRTIIHLCFNYTFHFHYASIYKHARSQPFARRYFIDAIRPLFVALYMWFCIMFNSKPAHKHIQSLSYMWTHLFTQVRGKMYTFIQSIHNVRVNDFVRKVVFSHIYGCLSGKLDYICGFARFRKRANSI